MPARQTAALLASRIRYPHTRPRATPRVLLVFCPQNLRQRPRRRTFHSTAPRRDEDIDRSKNHYDTLKIAPGASTEEIKRYVVHLPTPPLSIAIAIAIAIASTHLPPPPPAASSC
jgi:hypothetical protein